MPLVEIESFADPLFATLAQARLAAEGIDAHVFDANLSSLGLGPIVPARLMVDEADIERARAVLDAPGED